MTTKCPAAVKSPWLMEQMMTPPLSRAFFMVCSEAAGCSTLTPQVSGNSSSNAHAVPVPMT